MFIFRPERPFDLSRTSEPDNAAYNSRAAQAAGLRHVTIAERRKPPDDDTHGVTSPIGQLAPPRCCARWCVASSYNSRAARAAG